MFKQERKSEIYWQDSKKRDKQIDKKTDGKKDRKIKIKVMRRRYLKRERKGENHW